jgi:hypothetical protein
MAGVTLPVAQACGADDVSVVLPLPDCDDDESDAGAGAGTDVGVVVGALTDEPEPADAVVAVGSALAEPPPPHAESIKGNIATNMSNERFFGKCVVRLIKEYLCMSVKRVLFEEDQSIWFPAERKIIVKNVE